MILLVNVIRRVMGRETQRLNGLPYAGAVDIKLWGERMRTDVSIVRLSLNRNSSISFSASLGGPLSKPDAPAADT